MIKAFIVHGKDRMAVLELMQFLRQLSVEPIELEEQDDLGLTIIEKFEHYAQNCQLAFILMTPDDELKARQNVMIELGWFMRHVGRRNVIILHKQNTEVPSNIAGILYIQFEKSVMECSEKIRKRLTGMGLIP